DVLHDAIVRAIDAHASFRGQAKFTTWLFQIIVNCFRNRLRKRPTEPLPDVRMATYDVDDAEELGRIIAQKVSSLPERQGEVLVLISYEKISIAETATILGITEQNVRATLSHARQALKKELAPYLDVSRRER